MTVLAMLGLICLLIPGIWATFGRLAFGWVVGQVLYLVLTSALSSGCGSSRGS